MREIRLRLLVGAIGAAGGYGIGFFFGLIGVILGAILGATFLSILVILGERSQRKHRERPCRSEFHNNNTI